MSRDEAKSRSELRPECLNERFDEILAWRDGETMARMSHLMSAQLGFYPRMAGRSHLMSAQFGFLGRHFANLAGSENPAEPGKAAKNPFSTSNAAALGNERPKHAESVPDGTLAADTAEQDTTTLPSTSGGTVM